MSPDMFLKYTPMCIVYCILQANRQYTVQEHKSWCVTSTRLQVHSKKGGCLHDFQCFWSGPKNFGHVQNNLDLFKIIWTYRRTRQLSINQ